MPVLHILRCDQPEADVTFGHYNTDICGLADLKWRIAAVACGVLLLLNVYLLHKWKYRRHKTLLTFHNIRAAVTLLLLMLNSLELARAFLQPRPMPSTVDGHVRVLDPQRTSAGIGGGGRHQAESEAATRPRHMQFTGSVIDDGRFERGGGDLYTEEAPEIVVLLIGRAMLWNALLAIGLTLTLMWYHRVVELKKRVVFLYASCILCSLLFMVRILCLAEIAYDRTLTELETFLELWSALCLLGLGVMDGVTVYKERYRPDYLEDYEKIGYKHSLATFYSKACFWWLTPLLRFGRKEPLELEDLGQMRLEDMARAHYDHFLLIYKTAKGKNSNRSPSLWRCYVRSSWRMFSLGGALKLCGDLCALVGPLAIQPIVQYIESMYGGPNGGGDNSSMAPSGYAAPAGGGGAGVDGGDHIGNNRISMPAARLRSATGSALLQQAIKALARHYNNNNLNDYGNSNNSSGGVKHNGPANAINLVLQQMQRQQQQQQQQQLVLEQQTLASGTNDLQIYYANWSDLLANGWAMAWLVLVAALAQGALSQASTHILNMTGIRIKTSLQSLIYRKTLLLNASCIAAVTGGEAGKRGKRKRREKPASAEGETACQQGGQGLEKGLGEGKGASSGESEISNFQRAEPRVVGGDGDGEQIDSPVVVEGNRRDGSGIGLCVGAMGVEGVGVGVHVSGVGGNAVSSANNCQSMGATSAATETTTTMAASGNENGTAVCGPATKTSAATTTTKTTAAAMLKTAAKAPPTQRSIDDDESGRDGGGAGLNDVGAITNLMTEDTLNVMSFFWIAHYVWSIPLKIAVVMYLLHMQLGISAVIGSVVCILTMTPLQFLIGKAMSANSETMAKFTDERLRRIHDTFVGIKTIKLNAWDDVFLRKIGAARDQELKYLNKDSRYWTLMTILTHISTVLVSFVTLGVYVWLESEGDGANVSFTASHLFSALALFQQLTVPLLIFPITVPIIISAVVSTRRLERFFQAPEIQKQFEGIRHMARILSKSDASLDMYENRESLIGMEAAMSKDRLSIRSAAEEAIAEQNRVNEGLALRIKIPDGRSAPLTKSEPQTPASEWPASAPAATTKLDRKTAKKDLLRNSPYVLVKPRRLSHSSGTATLPLIRKYESWHRDSLLLKLPENTAVSVREGRFAWQTPREERVELSVKEMAIPRSRLTMIVGKNGAGKSSLLAGLLMEMPLVAGDMVWNKTSTTAFVPQHPWLLNASIRENILFGESFRPKRYDFVLDACALKPDIELMPAGDASVIGERGYNLSGGQRQRVAIARALYSSANVVILDDPLASLDNEVGHHVYERGIRRMLLRANRTVILVTQQLKLLQQADYLIVVRAGGVQAAGSYKEIEIKHPHIVAKWNSIIAGGGGDVVEGATAGEGRAKQQPKHQQHEHEHQQQHQQPLVEHETMDGAASMTAAVADDRTWRERRKLFKNVAKLGLQRSISLTTPVAPETEIAAHHAAVAVNAGANGRLSVVASMAALAAEEYDDGDDDLLPLPSKLHGSQSLSSFGSFKRTRSSMYGSRHLIYEMPLPIDECQVEDVILRRPRRRTGSQRSGASFRSRQMPLQTPNQQQTATAQQARPGSRGSSLRWSGLSVSSATTELRRSLLTASISSGASYASSNHSGCVPVVGGGGADAVGDANDLSQPQPPSSAAGQARWAWQPQHTANGGGGRQPTLARHDEWDDDEDDNDSDEGGCVSSVAAQQTPETASGFQLFLRRMSMRRSNKSADGSAGAAGGGLTTTAHGAAVAGGRLHLPGGAAQPILSISEETSPKTPTSPLLAQSPGLATIPSATTTAVRVPSIELSSAVTIDEEADKNGCVRVGDLGQSSLMATQTTAHAIMMPVPDAHNVIPTSMNEPTRTPTPATRGGTMPTATNATVERHVTSADAERKYGNIPARIYLLYLRASGVPIVLLFLASALIWQCLRVYTDVWLQQWTDDSSGGATPAAMPQMGASANTTATAAAAPPPPLDDSAHPMTPQQRPSHEVTYYFGVYAVISCVCIIMAALSTPAGQLAGCNARRRLHEQLLRAMMGKSLRFFQLTPLGRIMNRFSSDMAIIDKKIAATSQRLLQFSLLCLCAVLINVSITPWFVLLTAPICAAYYAIQKFYRCSARELQRIENSTNSPVISHLSETIQGVTTIRAYNQESRFTEILFRRLEANTIAFTMLNTSNRWLGISLDCLGGVIVFVAIVTALVAATISCSQQAAAPTTLSEGEPAIDGSPTASTFSPSPSLVGLAINYTLLMPIYLNWVVKLLADMEMYVGSVERIAYYAETQPVEALAGKEKKEKARGRRLVDTKKSQTDGAGGDDAHLKATEEEEQQRASHGSFNLAGGGDGGGGGACLTKANSTVELLPLGRNGDDCGGSAADKPNAAATAGNGRLVPSSLGSEARKGKVGRYQSVPISWPQRGDITFEDVSLLYEDQQQDVIKSITLHIPAGQRIGICGRTGSGKSSLALSLLGAGLLQTSGGRICIDGVDIAAIHPDEIRTRLSIIPQDVHLFSATIRENLDPAGYYADLALWNCLELAQLKDFVHVQLPQGLDTKIMDGGLHLSAGHRQLLCLARAILRGSVCLILDEATSALDSSTEKALLAAAHHAFRGRTILSIAHRLSTILDYDRIVVLENGRLIEDGTPAELLERGEGGAFYTLLHSGNGNNNNNNNNINSNKNNTNGHATNRH